MKLSNFDYYLPPDLIAQTPPEKRDQSRLLVLDKNSGIIKHEVFAVIVNYLSDNDILVVNNAKVIPARLFARRKTGGKVEILLLKRIGAAVNIWQALITNARKFKPGDKVYFSDDNLEAEVKEKGEEGKVILEFLTPDFENVLSKIGKMPLPPYIKREAEHKDKERYQTIYAEKEGAVAAPTAGLHFTKTLLDEIKAKGIKVVPITLYVGMGTFAPVRSDDITQHTMETEFYEIPAESAWEINDAIKAGKNIVSVGTTAVRTLESAAEKIDNRWQVTGDSKSTKIFIYPGYEFKIVKKLITNFHLPKSTLLMLVSAFAGQEMIKDAYKTAIEEKYRFFSYGDAMFIK